MDEKELFKNVLDWSFHHCRELLNKYRFSSSPEKRRHWARKILIEKVKKEPDTELLISPALKEKILLLEGVDLKRINAEYQEKKGSSKIKQEPKNYNQKPYTDIDIDIDNDNDEDSVKNLHLSKNFSQEWNNFKWYPVGAIASKLGIHKKTICYWREIGIKINGAPIRLQMIKRPFHWYAKGEWIIEFFLKTNVNVDMD